MMRIRSILVPALLALAATARADQVSTFEDLGLAANSQNLNPSNGTGLFASGGNSFNNVYSSYVYQGVTYQSFSGWAISSLPAPDPLPTTGAGDYNYPNQAVTGSGSQGSATYAVAFTFGDGSGDPNHPQGSFVNLAAGFAAGSIDVTNTVYDYLSMTYGDGFGKKFGAGDFFRLTITGYSGLAGAGSAVGEVDADLATGADILSTWKTVDLSSLARAGSLVFGLESSDNSSLGYGINTPAFFAADNLVVHPRAVPEPTSLALALAGAGLIGIRLRRRAAR